MTGILTAILTITGSFSLGQLLSFAIFGNKIKTINLENTVLNVILGIGALSFIIYITGVLGYVYSGIYWVILAVINVLTVILLILNYKGVKTEIQIFSNLDKILLILICIAGAAQLVLSFRPVTNLDALSHLVLLPKTYIYNHAIINLTKEVPFSTYPQLLTMLDTFVMALSNEVAVNQLHLLLGFLTCLIVYIVGKRAVNGTAGLFAALTIITSGVFFDMASIAKIDIGIAFFTAAVFYALMNWIYENENTWFYISIVFCALSFGVKYNGAFILILPAVFFFYNVFREGKLNWRYLGLVPLSALLYVIVISPWLLMNYSFTGNPLSPFLAKIFGDKSQLPEMTSSISSYFKKSSSGYFVYLKDVLLGMPILFFAFFIRWKNNTAAVLALISGVLYFLIGDFFLLHADRVFFPTFILLFFAAGCALYGFYTIRHKIIKYFLLTVYFGMILYSTYAIINEIFRSENFPYFSGKETKEEFLSRDVTSYPITLQANKLIPANEYLWSLAESRGYYFNQKFIQGFSYITTDIIRSPNIIDGMKKYNIKYVLFSDEPYFYNQQPPVFNGGSFLNDNFDLLAKEGHCSIYKLKAEPEQK